ncbi:unnamed protein product [Adineta steineri]|uniref:Uncharacterized protein n=1 Tax=Adineta steineri TaxID=433720 RepID=A0A814SYG7_9BILA|nr:unnamed protein product [Adineta steineri]
MRQGLASDSEGSGITSSDSLIFKQLQFNYLIGYVLAATGNGLQSSYQYAIFDSYDLRRSTIERIFLCGHISTITLGTLISSLSDKYVAHGIGHSLYNTDFEAWLVQDHHNSGLSADSLRQILGNSFVLSAIVGIATGFVSEFSADLLGYVAPYDIAIGIYLILIVFLLTQWTENYGDKEASSTTSFTHAIQILRNDPRIVLVGLITALFEVTMYIYVIEWTPALERATKWTIYKPLPLGIMYSIFMVFHMLGTIVYKPLSKRFRVQSFMLVIMLLTVVSFCLLVIAPNVIRATLMNYFRVPRIALMFIVIIWHLPLAVIFTFCGLMSVLTFVCLLILRSMKTPEEHIEPNEKAVLLPQIPSDDLKLKQPQTTLEYSGGIDNKSTSINIDNE